MHIGTEDNFLDLKVKEAVFNPQVLQAYLREQNYGNKQPMTMASVDYFDHSTVVTELTQGEKPQYYSQFSFLNKMDSFFVENILQNKLKIQFYLDTNKPNKEIGHCEIFLADLHNQERLGSVNSAVVEREYQIFPAEWLEPIMQKTRMKSLGTLRIKMRMRKPIRDVVRNYQNRSGINKAISANQV